MILLGCMVFTSVLTLVHSGTSPPKMLQKSRLTAYVGKGHELLNLTAEPCYCSFWTCYYCPGNLYCNVDNSGCCPYPGCRNGCGRWCICPECPVCCPDGTCTESKPKCCGKKCCAESDNCCKSEGNHCCEEGQSCCGEGCCSETNGKCCSSANSNEKICCKKDATVIENVPEEVVHDEQDVNAGYMLIFKYLCKTFGDLMPKKGGSRQYAVLLVGGPKQYKLDPKPKAFGTMGLVVGKNYAAARFIGVHHTEDLILQRADKLVRDYTKAHGQKPMLFLYSKNNPCCGKDLVETCNSGCAGKIASKLHELRSEISTMAIAWDVNYKMGAMPFDKAFLFSLNAMLSPGNARLSWSTNGYCRQSPRGWFQMRMFECLVEKVKSHPFCKPESLRGDLARLVNAVTWECGTKSQTDDSSYLENLSYDDDTDDDSGSSNNQSQQPLGGPPAREPTCWKEKVKILDKASNSRCSSLVKSAFDCATTHQEVDLGPALAPGQPSTFSNSAVDVRGAYNEPLCFTAGSCKSLKMEGGGYKSSESSSAVEGEPKEEL